MAGPVAQRGNTVFAEALRVTRLDDQGAPLWGSSSCIQTLNVVSFDFKNNWQSGVDLTKTDGRGQVCGSFKARDTIKYLDVTMAICDEDILLHELLTGGTVFTHSGTHTASVTTSSSTNPTTIVLAVPGSINAADIGAVITGTGIPSGTPTTVVSITDTTHVVISAAATGSATVTATVTGPTVIDGYQPPKVGVVDNPNGVSIELWARRVIGNTPSGYEHWAFPQVFLNDNDGTISDAFMDMSFTGFAVENANWGSGPMQDFDHDSSAAKQFIYEDSLPSPLADGYITITDV